MTWVIKLLILIVICSRTSYCREFRFDYKYDEEAGGHFKYNVIPTSWREAHLRCIYEGAKLASPTSKFMLNAMKKVFGSEMGTNAAMWTGVSAIHSKGDYFSVEGVPLARMPVSWAPDEPDNYNYCEDCLVMLPNGSLADVACNDSLPYICFRNNNTILTECGTWDPGYRLDKRTGSCYKFHRWALNWFNASAVCAAEGGHLAVIDKVGEQQVLKELFTNNPANLMRNSKNSDNAHVGIVYWKELDTWTTLHGDLVENLVTASIGAWDPKQPDSRDDAKNYVCGSIFRSGLYDDNSCSSTTPFICEKTPDSLL